MQQWNQTLYLQAAGIKKSTNWNSGMKIILSKWVIWKEKTNIYTLMPFVNNACFSANYYSSILWDSRQGVARGFVPPCLLTARPIYGATKIRMFTEEHSNCNIGYRRTLQKAWAWTGIGCNNYLVLHLPCNSWLEIFWKAPRIAEFTLPVLRLMRWLPLVPFLFQNLLYYFPWLVRLVN